ncbi:HutD family protein [Providencia sp. Je.9.19]|uniref:HutD family protein n=1 Tax=unclassified Providencia TaxID=2633465 RepID=UPI003DA90A21
MKIKCFNVIELPTREWSDGCGASQEVFCWPVASDYSLRASISTINQNSFLKQYSSGERLAILLDNQELCITDNYSFKHQLKQVGEAIRLPAYQHVSVEIEQTPVHLLNFIFNEERWIVKNHILSNSKKLPINQAGIVYILSGEWRVTGASCNVMTVGQGGWWLPDIGEGELTPQTSESQLIWIEILPNSTLS